MATDPTLALRVNLLDPQRKAEFSRLVSEGNPPDRALQMVELALSSPVATAPTQVAQPLQVDNMEQLALNALGDDFFTQGMLAPPAAAAGGQLGPVPRGGNAPIPEPGFDPMGSGLTLGDYGAGSQPPAMPMPPSGISLLASQAAEVDQARRGGGSAPAASPVMPHPPLPLGKPNPHEGMVGADPFGQSPTAGVAPMPGAEEAAKGFLGQGKDFWRTVLEAGLATMNAGSQPGATALGALGEGGLVALSNAESRKRADVQDRDATRRTDIAAERNEIAREGQDERARQFDESMKLRRAVFESDQEYQAAQMRITAAQIELDQIKNAQDRRMEAYKIAADIATFIERDPLMDIVTDQGVDPRKFNEAMKAFGYDVELPTDSAGLPVIEDTEEGRALWGSLPSGAQARFGDRIVEKP